MQLTAEFPVTITHPEKLLWPESGVTKADYLKYLIDVSPLLLRHMANKPITMIRYPNGIHGHSFYQKDKPSGTPDWVTTVPIWSTDRKAFIHSVVVDSVATLVWLGNIACLEMHVGFTTLSKPDTPIAVAFDLDPTVQGFERVREVAMALHDMLDSLGLPHVAKTSGATGLQVFIPLIDGHSFEQTRVFTKHVAEYLLARLPHVVTLERLKRNRGTKVYVDYLQHGEGRTLIAPYSARATTVAAVSCPVSWTELAQGAVPENFTVRNMAARVRAIGDLMGALPATSLHEVVAFLQGKART